MKGPYTEETQKVETLSQGGGFPPYFEAHSEEENRGGWTLRREWHGQNSNPTSGPWLDTLFPWQEHPLIHPRSITPTFTQLLDGIYLTKNQVEVEAGWIFLLPSEAKPGSPSRISLDLEDKGLVWSICCHSPQ
jgi:hypothetical protein